MSNTRVAACLLIAALAFAAEAQDAGEVEDAGSAPQPTAPLEPLEPLPSLLKRANAHAGKTLLAQGSEADPLFEQLEDQATQVPLDEVGGALVEPLTGTCHGISESCDEFTDHDLAELKPARLKQAAQRLFIVSLSHSWSGDAGTVLLPYDFRSKRFTFRLQASMCSMPPSGGCLLLKSGRSTKGRPVLSKELESEFSLAVPNEALARALASNREELSGFLGDTQLLFRIPARQPADAERNAGVLIEPVAARITVEVRATEEEEVPQTLVIDHYF